LHAELSIIPALESRFCCGVASYPGSKRFAESIVLLDGTKLGMLREAIAYLGKIILKAEHDMPEVQTAADLLGQPIMTARSSLRA
jgi:hypothetical protein